MLSGDPGDGWVSVDVPIPAEGRGKVWSVLLPKGDETRIFRLSGIPPYVAESAAACFPPPAE